MSSSSRVVTTLLDGDWRASLGDLVLFEEIWKWGFGFGGFWRWCSEFELLFAGAHAFCLHHRISHRHRLLCLSPYVRRLRLLCPSSSFALSVVVVSSLHCSHHFRDATDQTAIDNYMVQQLDGTVNEWANAILAVSLALCKAGASVKKVPLYKFWLRTSIEVFTIKMPKGAPTNHVADFEQDESDSDSYKQQKLVAKTSSLGKTAREVRLRISMDLSRFARFVKIILIPHMIVRIIQERPEEPQIESKEDQPLVLVKPPTLLCIFVKPYTGVEVKERSQIFYTTDTFVLDDHDMTDSFVLEFPNELQILKEDVHAALPKYVDAPFVVDISNGEGIT
ncbi:hypothetical protein Syun_020721 [Stephania yunnanensis]|uniref:Enolase N-terminal domain-containing protein n=1 Tax=Stephania yunnanensis TaxID=152371 RepID=A0AAP0IEA6_9MAGN